MALTSPEVISYWPSYRSEVSGIGPTQSDFVLAQLQVKGQRHLPQPKMISIWPNQSSKVSGIGLNQNDFVLAKLQARAQLHWPDLKCFRISPVTGPRSAALARTKMISYWPSYRSEVSGIGLTQSDFVLAQIQVRV